MPELDWMAVA